MITYSFHELTPRAQENAISAYYSDPAVMETVNTRQDELNAQGSEDPYLVEYALADLGWRFTEHGERVA